MCQGPPSIGDGADVLRFVREGEIMSFTLCKSGDALYNSRRPKRLDGGSGTIYSSWFYRNVFFSASTKGLLCATSVCNFA